MKILIGIRKTSQLSGIYEDAVQIEGQSTDVITTGSEEFVRGFVKEIRELEKELPQLYKERYHFEEYDYVGYSEEEYNKIVCEYNDKINNANTLKKYKTVIMIDGDIL